MTLAELFAQLEPGEAVELLKAGDDPEMGTVSATLPAFGPTCSIRFDMTKSPDLGGKARQALKMARSFQLNPGNEL